jgi:hypothetical protein
MATCLFDFVEEPTPLTLVAGLLASYLYPASIALWIHGDARRRQRSLAYDFAGFVYLFWPVLAPVYLFRTRGLRAFGPIAVFLSITGMAIVLGSVFHSAAMNSR